MRFKASLTRENTIHLYNIISQLEKLGKVAAIFATTSSIKIAVVAENMEAPKCYAEVFVHSLFQDYKINSLSDDSILFEIGLENFVRALGSARRAHLCTLKLVKRGQQPCICCKIKELDGGSMEVFHDIQIRLLRVEEVFSFAPPEVPPPMVALELPQLKDSHGKQWGSSSSSSSSATSSSSSSSYSSSPRSASSHDAAKSRLCSIIDKMTKFTKYLSITAYKTGKLEIRSSHTACTITTIYSDMISLDTDNPEENFDMSNATAPDRSSRSKSTVTVDGRKLSVALNSGGLPIQAAYIYMTDNSALVVHMALQSKDPSLQGEESEIGSITYYVPVVLSDEDLE